MTGGLTLPPLFTTAEPDPFALRSIRDRHTLSLVSVIEESNLEEPYRSRLQALHREALAAAPLSDPFAREGWDPALFEPRELADWRQELAPIAGRSWYELPWYFAEAFFFLALLFAFGYYEPAGPHQLQDPFAPLKRRELARPGGGLDTASGLAGAYSLSFLRHDEREVLVDHTAALFERLQSARRIDFILDNRGPELVCDLMLASWLLLEDPQRRVVLHAKRSPFYVSDATASDVRATLQALTGSPQAPVRQAGQGLLRQMQEGRLAVREHWFWNGPLFFSDIPAELRWELGASNLVLIKGDANLRRLVGDRKWPPTTRMELLTRYFPAPLAALRTLKSELVLDLEPGQAESLDREDPEWRINGRRRIIRLVDPGSRPKEA